MYSKKENHKKRRYERRKAEREAKAALENKPPILTSSQEPDPNQVNPLLPTIQEVQNPNGENGDSSQVNSFAQLDENGNETRLTPSGLRVSTEAGFLARAVNWQQKNRFSLEKAVVDGKLVDATEENPSTYDTLQIAAVKAVNCQKSLRTQTAGMRTLAQLSAIVQRDDHAKLRAELRPTVINQQVNTVVESSQETVTPRRVVLMIPDNGRDPKLK